MLTYIHTHTHKYISFVNTKDLSYNCWLWKKSEKYITPHYTTQAKHKYTTQKQYKHNPKNITSKMQAREYANVTSYTH
jgi:hypothetical protein